MITDEDKERVRQATDIVSLVSETVVLRPRGGNDFWGCCPFHQEKSPSFHVTPSTGLWHCFGCGTGGDVFDYVMRREGLDFLDAVRYLADRAHIDIDDSPGSGPVRKGPKRTRLFDVLEAAQGAFSLRLMRGKGAGPDAARAYLSARGLNSRICAKWHLGYADGSVSLARSLQQAGFSRDEIQCLPGEGVYAGLACVEGRVWPTAVNVGKPRSFGGEEGHAFLEPTLLGFSGDLYDKELSVCFLDWLREPRVFPSLEVLERTVLGNVEWVRRYVGAGELRLGGAALAAAGGQLPDAAPGARGSDAR